MWSYILGGWMPCSSSTRAQMYSWLVGNAYLDLATQSLAGCRAYKVHWGEKRDNEDNSKWEKACNQPGSLVLWPPFLSFHNDHQLAAFSGNLACLLDAWEAGIKDGVYSAQDHIKSILTVLWKTRSFHSQPQIWLLNDSSWWLFQLSDWVVNVCLWLVC